MEIILNNNHTISWVNRLSSWAIPQFHLEHRIGAIASKSFLSNQDKNDLQLAFKVAYRWTWTAGRMKSLLRKIPKEHIEELIVDLLKEGHESEIPKKLDRFLSFLDQPSLLDLSDLKTSKKAASWFHSRGMIKNTTLNNNIEKEGRALFKEFRIEAKHFIFHILDILVSLLGINELGEKKHSPWSSEDRMNEYEAIHKLESYGKLIGYPAIMFGFFYTYVQLRAAAFALATIATSLIVVALIAYHRYWRPCPKDHYGLKNLTIEMLNSKDPIFARQEILRKIEKAFKEKKGVILVGDPGAGKSWIPRSLAEQITEKKICTFIKNPQVFACGASKLKTKESSSLDSISERFKHYSQEVIFFFDEFHSLFKADKVVGNNKADDLKMFCEDFKYVIGATTTKEFKKFIKKQPAIIDRRFIVIKVGKLADKKIKIVLSQYLQMKHPTIRLDAKVLDDIVQNAKEFNPNTSKVDAAQTLLNRAIKEMETIEFNSLESEIDNTEAEKKLLEQKLVNAKVGKDARLIKAIGLKQSKIEELKNQLDKKNQQVERMKKIEGLYLKLKRQSFSMSDPNVKLLPKSPLERQWIKLQAKIKVVGDFIEQERADLSLPQRLDRDLIEKILQDQKG